MTMWCPVSLTLKQRASLGKYSARAFFTPSHDHITGAVLRGALARAYIDRHGAPSQANSNAFRALFDGSARFGPLSINGSRIGQSIRRCKYHDAQAGHPTVVDLAFDPMPAWCAAGSATVSSGVETTSATATAIDPKTGTVAEAQLFAREALHAQRIFSGWIVVPDQATADHLAQIDRVVIGARGSVMGSAVLTWGAPVETPLPAALDRVVLRTLSPTFLTDDSGRPMMDAVTAFEDALGLTLNPDEVWAGRELLDATGGWHAASRLPKPREIGLDAGITVVASSPSAGKLKDLLDHGLGLRRSEGFGWVSVAEPLTESPDLEKSPDEGAQLVAALFQIPSDLDRARRRWLANKLPGLRAGDHQAVTAALREPGAMGWSAEHRAWAFEVLLNTPNHLRPQRAHELRENDA